MQLLDILLEEFLNMIRRGLVCLLFASLAWGQAANSNATPAPTAPPAQNQAPSAPMAAQPTTPDQVPMNEVIITIPGVCENWADKPTDCKTTITRAEFEELVKAVAPNMPSQAHRGLAQRYASALVMAQEARKEGLDKGPKYEQMQKLSQMQTLAQLLSQSLRDKAGEISDADIDDYYKKNLDSFKQVDIQRIFVPVTKEMAPSKVKLTPAQTELREKQASTAMKTEATSLQKRAVAGGDFEKLQAEAFTVAGMKSKPPTTKMDKVRKDGLTPEQQSAFDLKAGEVSPLITDESGYFIFKGGEKATPPLDQVKEEIRTKLRAQRLQDSMQAIQKMATPTLNDKYFAAPAPTPMPGTPVPPPGANPQAPHTTEHQ